jgi:uncharacterized membrane protein YeaQ/YmgE (transglycosylase-associated protein family)
MSILGILLLLVIAAICGAIAQAIVGYSAGGCLVSIILGAVGAYIGYWIASAFNLPLLWTVNIEGTQFPIVWSIIGAVIFVAIVSLFTRCFARYE